MLRPEKSAGKHRATGIIISMVERTEPPSCGGSVTEFAVIRSDGMMLLREDRLRRKEDERRFRAQKEAEYSSAHKRGGGDGLDQLADMMGNQKQAEVAAPANGYEGYGMVEKMIAARPAISQQSNVGIGRAGMLVPPMFLPPHVQMMPSMRQGEKSADVQLLESQLVGAHGEIRRLQAQVVRLKHALRACGQWAAQGEEETV